MDIELVIGDRDAFAVERQLNFFKQIKTQIPIVGVLHQTRSRSTTADSPCSLTMTQGAGSFRTSG